MPHVVLIAEDDPATLSGLVELLKGAGYDAVPAPTFTEAKRLLPVVHPAVIVADVRLGEYNGLQLVVQAGHLLPRPAAIVTSGFHDPVLAAEAARMGATFLLKPLNPADLLALVAKLAENVRSPGADRSV
jgi:DNA-binding NtrC family response regulator